MKIQIHMFDPYKKQTNPEYLGYIEMETFNAEECWRLCNWTAWTEAKPEELHADIGSCSHGICFTNPETEEKWLAKSVGWFVGSSLETTDYVRKNINNPIWL